MWEQPGRLGSGANRGRVGVGASATRGGNPNAGNAKGANVTLWGRGGTPRRRNAQNLGTAWGKMRLGRRWGWWGAGKALG